MAYEKQNFTNGLVLMAEHLNKIEAQVALNETSIGNKADINHEHSYELTGVLLDSGTQELTNGSLRIIDGDSVNVGFEVKRPMGDTSRSVGLCTSDDGSAVIKLIEVDESGNEKTLNVFKLSDNETTLNNPLTIANGGTGASTASDALVNLGAASQSWVTEQIQAAVNATWEASY